MAAKENFYFYLIRNRLGDFMIYVAIMGMSFLSLFIFSKKINNKNDIQLITGRFLNISKTFNPASKNIRHTKMDILSFIHLIEYPSKIQISYGVYDEEGFEKNVKPGDTINIYIDKNDIKNLYTNGAKIRGFSLELNGVKYLNEKTSIGWLSTMNELNIIIGVILLAIFSLYTKSQYKVWKRL